MDKSDEQERRADRLYTITQRIGYALWQIQELEEVTAQYFVLVAQAKRGMRMEEASVLVEDARTKTFGRTITRLVKGKHMPSELEPRFNALLAERNWLAHNSRSTNRNAVYSDQACLVLLARLNRIEEETLSLLKAIGKYFEEFVTARGVSTQEIDALTEKTLKAWRGSTGQS